MVIIQNETALFAIINLFGQKSSLPVFIIIQLMTFHEVNTRIDQPMEQGFVPQTPLSAQRLPLLI
jgi:hypothetical protein